MTETEGASGTETLARGAAAPARGRTFATSLVLLLAGAHFVHDVFTAFLAPLLPLLIAKLRLSLFQAGSLAVFVQLPSLLNPVLGSFVDRSRAHRLLVAVGPGASGTLMCSMGLAPSYAALAVLLLTAGVSVAFLHVSAPVVIRQLSADRVGRGMSFFMVAGELARTVGPLIAVQAVAWFGLEGLWRMIPAALGSSALLWWRLGRVTIDPPRRPPSHLFAVWSRMRRVWLAVAGVVLSRAFLAGALVTFLPTFLFGEGRSLLEANVALSVVELAGAAGALASGSLSDRLGRRSVLLVAVAASPPLMLGFLEAGSGALSYVLLALLGLAMLSTAPVLMALVLENAGDDAAAANGTYFMISFAARALILLAVGAMGDALGLRRTFYWCAALATIGLPFVLLVPSGRDGLQTTEQWR